MKKLLMAHLALLSVCGIFTLHASHEEFYSREVDEPKTSGLVDTPEQEGMSSGGPHSVESELRRIHIRQTGLDFEPDTAGIDGDIPVIVPDDENDF